MISCYSYAIQFINNTTSRYEFLTVKKVHESLVVRPFYVVWNIIEMLQTAQLVENMLETAQSDIISCDMYLVNADNF